MIFRRRLACSFCRRTDAEVEKLVAGPRVYICDRCAAEVVRIMNSADPTPTSPMVPPRWTWPTLVQRLHRAWRRVSHRTLRRNPQSAIYNQSIQHSAFNIQH